MSIIKWFNKTFRGVVYAEDSTPVGNDETFGIWNFPPELDPYKVELRDKEEYFGAGWDDEYETNNKESINGN